MGDDAKEPIQSVQVFGRKKSATAVAYCKRGKGLIKVTISFAEHPLIPFLWRLFSLLNKKKKFFNWVFITCNLMDAFEIVSFSLTSWIITCK